MYKAVTGGIVVSIDASFAVVLQYVLTNCVEGDTIQILGAANIPISAGCTMTSKNRITIDARSAKFTVADGETGFNLTTSYSIIRLGTLHGNGKANNGVGVAIKGSYNNLHINEIDNLKTGVYFDDGVDNDLDFQAIAACAEGIVFGGSHIEGNRIKGNFTLSNDKSIYANCDTLLWNYIDVVAIDSVDCDYGIYVLGGKTRHEGNHVKIRGFLGLASTKDIYDNQGGWTYDILPPIAEDSPMFAKVNVTLHAYSSISYRENRRNGTDLAGVTSTIPQDYPGSRGSLFTTINAQATGSLTASNVTLADNGDGSFRYTSTDDANYVYFATNHAGKKARYIILKYKYVSGVFNPAYDGNIYYAVNAGHGFDGSYMKTMGPIIKDGMWHVQYLDMWALTAGGEDWKNSTITSVRFGWNATTGTANVIDIAFIALANLDGPGLT